MQLQKYDFVVCGAGISGMIAAVSAARKGLKVALLNDRSVPGGNASSEIGVVIQGSSHHGLNYSVYAKETGLMDELRSKLDYAVAHCGYDVAAACDAVFLDFLYAEHNIDLYLNTVVTDVSTENGCITGVIAYRMKQDEKLVFAAPLYADCTGDAVVAHKAGADTSMGAEARCEYGEKSAAEEPQTWTMGHTLYFEIEDVGHPVKFVRPAFAHDVAKMDFMKDMNNPAKLRMLYVGGRFWTLEYGGQVNTISDNEHITLELRKLVYGLWDYIKNSGKYPNAENFKIKRVYSVAGSRESRRILGDYILTETDVDQNTDFSDSVAVGGWPLDLHAPKGIYDELPASAFIPVVALYNIPYRCLYSRNVGNLFMAGRNISTTHIALSSTRVIGTCGAVAQAIGTAAWLCCKDAVLPREITSNIEQLQQALLMDDQFILGKQEVGNREVERRFSACASSSAVYENISAKELEKRLDINIGIALPLKTARLETVCFKVKNLSDREQTLHIRVLKGTRKEAYVPERLDKAISLKVEPSFCGWKNIPVETDRGEDGKVYLVLDQNPELAVFGGSTSAPGAITSKFYTEKTDGYDHNTCPLNAETGYIGQDNLRKTRQPFGLLFRDVVPEQNMYAAEHLLNGYTRPYGHMNMWLSEDCNTAQVILKSEKPCRVDRMEVFFDNQLEDDVRSYIHTAMVKDYDVVIKTPAGEKRVQIRDNFERRNIIDINDQVTELRLELLSTYGDPRFAMYGIKLY